jgi:superfamily II DNA/RNA helicase
MGFFDDDDSGDDGDQQKKNRPMMMMSLESLQGKDDDDDNEGNELDEDHGAAGHGGPGPEMVGGLGRDENAHMGKSVAVAVAVAAVDSDEANQSSAAKDPVDGPIQNQNNFSGDVVTAKSQTTHQTNEDDEDEYAYDGNNDDDNREEEGGNNEIDPLDAYMNSLDNQQMSEPKYIRSRKDHPGGRLDMENEDEATGHWEERSTRHLNEQTSYEPASPSSSSNELYSAFNRSSDSSHRSKVGEDRNVDIQLQQVQHDTMKYSQFKKCFLDLQEHNNNNNNSSDPHNHNIKNSRSNRNTYEGQKWRKQNAVLCTPPLDPIYDFAELRDVFPPQVSEWNTKNNLTKPTLVQSQTLGVALCGKDAIVTASTGSGKTLAYLWPCVTHLMENHGTDISADNNDDGNGNGGTSTNTNERRQRSRALVLVPTRELALQVEKVAKSLFTNLPLTALAITGGNMGRYQLSQKLQGSKPHLVVATPGRLLDVLSAQQKNKQDWLLPNITFLVMDEADKMISLGFANQVTQVLQNLRPDRQSLLTSATFDSRLQRRCQEWMHSPTRISVGKTGESSKHVLQHVVCLPTPDAKLKFLRQSLPKFTDVGRTLVFCRTREGVDKLASELKSTTPVETMHGDKHPVDRKAALKAFIQGNVMVLLATDVAGQFTSIFVAFAVLPSL